MSLHEYKRKFRILKYIIILLLCVIVTLLTVWYNNKKDIFIVDDKTLCDASKEAMYLMVKDPDNAKYQDCKSMKITHNAKDKSYTIIRKVISSDGTEEAYRIIYRVVDKSTIEYQVTRE